MIRVCPKRDTVCPYGMKCPYVIDRYTCKEEPLKKEPLMANVKDNLSEAQRALTAIDGDTKCILLLVYHEERDPASGRTEKSVIEINEVNIEPVRDAIILRIKRLSNTLAQDLRAEADKLDPQGPPP